MFSKKVEKCLLRGLIIYFVLFILTFFILAIICNEKSIEIKNLNTYFRIGIGIPLIAICLYYTLIRVLYLSFKLLNIRKLLHSKDYTALSKTSSNLLNKNPNQMTKSLYCISLIYNKEYDEFIKFYELNQKSLMSEIRIYLFIVKFLQQIPTELTELEFAKRKPKLMLVNLNISTLLEKIEQYYMKNYSKCLGIQLSEELANDEVFALVYKKCNELSKQEINKKPRN